MSNLTILFYNKKIFSNENDKSCDFPVTRIYFFGPLISKGVHSDSFGGDPYFKISTNIPISLDFVKSDLHWSFSVAFIIGIRISYQWGY